MVNMNLILRLGYVIILRLTCVFITLSIRHFHKVIICYFPANIIRIFPAFCLGKKRPVRFVYSGNWGKIMDTPILAPVFDLKLSFL